MSFRRNIFAQKEKSGQVDGLIGYFTLDETTGDFNDSFGSNLCSIAGTILRGEIGVKNNCIYNSGGGLSFQLNEIKSFIAWVNMDVSQGSYFYICDARSSYSAYMYRTTNFLLTAQRNDAGSWVNTTADNLKGLGWKMIYVEFNSSFTGTLHIGKQYNHNDNPGKGYFDEIRFFNKPLSEAEKNAYLL